MGVRIEIPGLDTIIPEVADGSVLVLESGTDPAKSYLVRRLSRTAAHAGRKVTFVTSRDRAETIELLEDDSGEGAWREDHFEVLEWDDLNGLDEIEAAEGLLAVDSFSFLSRNLEATELARKLRALRNACRRDGSVAVLGADRGLLEPRSEAVVSHLSDGLIEFHAKEGPEGLVRFLRIPKWMNGQFVDRNIYYGFDGRRMAIDLRSRVL